MPHIIVQHSPVVGVQFSKLLSHINKTLVATFPAEFPNPNALKSRAVLCEDYAIGIDEQDNLHFIHIEMKILEGRSDETRCAMGKTAIEAAQEFLQQHLEYEGKHVQVTCEVNFLYVPAFQKIVFDGIAQ